MTGEFDLTGVNQQGDDGINLMAANASDSTGIRLFNDARRDVAHVGDRCASDTGFSFSKDAVVRLCGEVESARLAATLVAISHEQMAAKMAAIPAGVA